MDTLFACSGPGAGATIAESIRIGETHAAVAGGLLLVSLAVAGFARQRAMPAVLLGLLALHPAWTVSAISGDCGFFKRDASWMFTSVGCVALCWQLGRGLWSRRAAPAERRHAEPVAATDPASLVVSDMQLP